MYAEILKNKLEEECENKNLILKSQNGFKKGRGTIDNIFMMDHLIQREKREKDGKIYTTFIDLKAAFDNVDRNNGKF